MPLFDYMKQTQRFIHDSKMEMVDPADLIVYINRARREVAMRTQCLRVLPTISGSVIGATVGTVGHNYTAPTVTITPPDFPSGALPFPNGVQATANIQATGGTISNIAIDNGGSGYFQPQIIINDPTGSGATATAQTSLLNTVNQGQEVYPFSGVDLTPFPGVGSIVTVKSVSIIYANYRYSIPVYSFSRYQALIRQYPFQYQYVPTMGAQFGQGTNGSFYLYPIGSQTYQMEWDCFCVPSDILTDQDVEALPQYPWTDGVPFLAAYYAFLEMQNLNAANFYNQQFDKWMTRYGTYARPGRQINPYGRP